MPPLHDAAEAASAIRSAIDRHAALDAHVQEIQGELMQVLCLLAPAQHEVTVGSKDAVHQATALFDRAMQTPSRKAQRLAYTVKVLAELMQHAGGARGPGAQTITRDVIPPRRLPAAAEGPHEEGMGALPLQGDADSASMLVDIQENLDDVDALGG
jgi:hypothetical protein